MSKNKKRMMIFELLFFLGNIIPVSLQATAHAHLSAEIGIPIDQSSVDCEPRIRRMKKRAARERAAVISTQPQRRPSFIRRGLNACVDAFAITIGSVVGCVAACYLLSALAGIH